MNRLDKQVAPEAQNMLKQAKESMAQVNALLASDAAARQHGTGDAGEPGGPLTRALADFLQANPEALLRGRGGPDPGAGPVPGN